LDAAAGEDVEVIGPVVFPENNLAVRESDLVGSQHELFQEMMPKTDE
jgi:hypothetical protein